MTATATLLTAIAALYTAGVFSGNSTETNPNSIYNRHEHPFYKDQKIKSMSQDQGNQFCRERFDQLDANDFRSLDINPSQINHVWAHILNGDCVANTR